jgi:O-antigen/teichoic acid export membrane protein
MRDRLLVNNAIYLAGSVGAGAFGYAFHFLTGRLLGPASYAVVASAIAALYLLTLPGVVFQIISARFTSLAEGRGQLDAIRPLLMRLSLVGLIVGGVIAVLVAGFAPFAARYLQISDLRVVYVVALSSWLGLLVATNRGALQGMRRFLALSGNVLTDMLTRVVVAAGLILAGAGALGGVIALVVGPLLAYTQSLFPLRTVGRLRGGEAARLVELGRYGGLASLAAGGVIYLYNIDLILAKHFLSATAAGIYAASAVLARVVYFLGLTIASVMFPEVATLHARNEAHLHVVDLSLLMLGVIAVVLTITYLAVPDLVILPFGREFGSVRGYLGPFAAALSLLAVANLLITYFLSVDNAGFVAPLVGACVLETVLITAFHADAGQILSMVVISVAVLAASLGILYLVERIPGLRAAG